MKTLDRLLQRIRIDQVAPYIKRGAHLLDIGCADGALLRRVPHLSSYVGIDPEAPASQGGKVTYLRGTFPHAALDSHSVFDVVTALAVLEHVPRAAQPEFARAVHRILAPDGKLLITVPSPLVDPILDVLMKLRVLDGMETDEHYGFDPAQTIRLFTANGFALVRHRRFELGLNHLFVFQRE